MVLLPARGATRLLERKGQAPSALIRRRGAAPTRRRSDPKLRDHLLVTSESLADLALIFTDANGEFVARGQWDRVILA